VWSARERTSWSALMSDDKLFDAVQSGLEAEHLLNSDAFKTAVEMLQHDLITRWQACNDPAERDRIWIATNLLNRLVDAIGHIVANGHLARHVLDNLLNQNRTVN
jgi:hypothetical protein